MSTTGMKLAFAIMGDNLCALPACLFTDTEIRVPVRLPLIVAQEQLHFTVYLGLKCGISAIKLFEYYVFDTLCALWQLLNDELNGFLSRDCRVGRTRNLKVVILERQDKVDLENF
jgi:hypothetical protein